MRFIQMANGQWVNPAASGINRVPQAIFIVDDKHAMWRGFNGAGNQWFTYGEVKQEYTSTLDVTKIPKSQFESLAGISYQRVLMESKSSDDGIYRVYTTMKAGAQ